MPPRSGRSHLIAAAVVLLVPAAVLATTQPAAAAPTALVAIDSTVPHWLTASGSGARMAAKAVPADAEQKLDIRVYLAPKGGEAALQQAVAAVSDPTSSAYGDFLTAKEYRATYRPTKSSATKVSRWLRSKHLKVTGTEGQRRYVSARGTIAQLDRAFGVSLTRLQHDGKEVVAPTTPALVPASVASSVLTVGGLDTSQTLMARTARPTVDPPRARQNARPCSAWFGQLSARYADDYATPLPRFRGQTLSYAPCGYTGQQLRSAYTPGTSLTGKGVTVAVTGAYAWPYIEDDTARYAAEHGDAPWAPGQLVQRLPSSYQLEKECGPSNWSVEQTLDIEALHALAPAADVRYYGSSSCNDDDFGATLARVVDEDVATVVTNSWGGPDETTSSDLIAAYDQIFLQGALQGMTFLFASGDDGDNLALTGLKQGFSPASNPNVTAVGGTSTGIDARGRRSFDTGWGTMRSELSPDGRTWSAVGFDSGAGGGFSSLYNRPAYQKGVVPSSAPPGRAFPDIAMLADPATGFLIGQTQAFPDYTHYGEYRFGGTSLATPLAAAMLALTIEGNGGRAFGALNPRLYSSKDITDDVVKQPSQVGVVRPAYADPADSSSAVSYSVRELGRDSSLWVDKGWDPVTGLGVPNAGFLGLTTPKT